MLAMLPSQLAFSDPITTHIPLIQLLLASLGTLSVALYFLGRHEIEKAHKGRDARGRIPGRGGWGIPIPFTMLV